MRRIVFAPVLGSLALVVVLMFAAPSSMSAQLVPITRCNSAIPCNIPYGLRPADAAAWTPGNNLGQGNTAISMSNDFNNGFAPKIDKPPISEDPVEAAARMYVRKYPSAPGTPATAAKSQGSSVEGRASKPAPVPTPQPKP